MKELTIEEKAKAYDEAKARMNKAFNSNRCTIGFMNEIFPELIESEDERIRKELLDYFKNKFKKYPSDPKFSVWIAWLEKQGRQKPLYIRFGDVPSNETSKIYRGEVEIGEENGVSVYPAFEVNGNIVLGLTLPITKTTLYTQQHLLEYDNRPCYLVNGDYVGKDTDGEPLIRNITIIKRLDNYRIKNFEKQGEQKPVDKVEPKFKVGDWIVDNNVKTPFLITGISNGKYDVVSIYGNDMAFSFREVERFYHLWTIQDAKDGDVLAFYSEYRGNKMVQVGIIEKYVGKHGGCSNTFKIYVGVNWENNLQIGEYMGCSDIRPATKEQSEQLEKAMADAGYTFDFEKKELKKIEQKPILDVEIPFGTDSELVEEAITIPDGCYAIIEDNKVILRKGEQKPAEWSKEDEEKLDQLYNLLRSGAHTSQRIREEWANWLKSLKDRVQLHPKYEWSKEDIDMIDWLIRCCEEEHEELCNDKYGHQDIVSDLKRDCRKKWDWLESLKNKAVPQSQWKPSEEQMEILQYLCETSSHKNEKVIPILESLYNDLKKLSEE